MKVNKISSLGAVGIMALSLGLGQGLHATEVRSAGMGLDAQPWAAGGQLPYIFVNPAAMGQFGQMIYGETNGTSAGSNAGIMLNLGAFNLGVFAGRNVSGEHSNIRGSINTTVFDPLNAGIKTAGVTAVGTNVSAATFFTGPTSALLNQNAQVIGQFNLGTMALGVGLSYARTANDATNDITLPAPVTSESFSTADSSLQATLGLAMDLSGFLLDVSAALKTSDILSTYAYDNTTTQRNAEFKNTGLGDILIDAHGAFAIGQSKLHVMGGFDILDASSKSYSETITGGTTNSATDTFTKTGTRIRAGVSDEIQISDSVMSFVGLGFSYTSWTEEYDWETDTAGTVAKLADAGTVSTYKTEMLTLPVFFGMEANLSEKWQARFGITANVLSISPTNNVTNVTTTTGDNSSMTDIWNDAAPTFRTGISFMHNNFSFDWNVALALFTSGPNFIGGAAPGLASDFAVSYKFEGGEKKKTPITR